MSNINKIIATIILVAIILGWSIIVSQEMKQDSIEYQKRLDISADKAEQELKIEAERYKQIKLDNCLSEGDEVYWSYVKLNWTDEGDWTYTAYNSVWDEAEERKQSNNDTCFKKYK